MILWAESLPVSDVTVNYKVYKMLQSEKLEKMELFNLHGSDALDDQQLIGGHPTGVSNMNETKYVWANALYRVMVKNHWIPEKVNMEQDKSSVLSLDPNELEAAKDTLAFIIFLDSYQVLNLPTLREYITAPGVKNLITIQEFQEVIHSQSYQYILDSLFPLTTREDIYNRWRTNPNILKRVKFITEVGQAFRDDPTEHNYKRVLAMNFILESIYFYQGFMFFDQLASRGKLIATSTMIDYIRTDEVTHIAIFLHIIKDYFKPEDYSIIQKMILTAVEHEIEWTHTTYGDNKILGINNDSSTQYAHYLANHRSNMFGLEMPFPKQGLLNPYSHLDEKSRANFFEAAAVTDYDRADSINGWDF